MRHDTAIVCSQCGGILTRALQRIALLAADIEITIAKLDIGITRGPGQPDLDGWERHDNALEAIELPLRPPAIVDRDATMGELTTWTRHVATERGRELPRHALAHLALWLSVQVEYIRHQPYADEAIPALLGACATAARIPDQRARHHLVGRCQGCAAPLYALEGDTVVACDECGEETVASEATRRLLEDGRDHRVTAGEAARLIVAADPLVGVERVRKLVNQWSHRELIVADDDGRYALGQILDRWTRALAARVA